jgi:hypothetical protein
MYKTTLATKKQKSIESTKVSHPPPTKKMRSGVYSVALTFAFYIYILAFVDAIPVKFPLSGL